MVKKELDYFTYDFGFDFNIPELFPTQNLNPNEKAFFEAIFNEVSLCLNRFQHDFMLEHLVLAYMRVIEKLPEKEKKRLMILPWYTDSLQYIHTSNLSYTTKTTKYKVSPDVVAFSNAYKKYAPQLNPEIFIYLLIYCNIHHFQNRHVIPYGEKLTDGTKIQDSIISRIKTCYYIIRRFSSFDDFLRTSASQMYNHIIYPANH